MQIQNKLLAAQPRGKNRLAVAALAIFLFSSTIQASNKLSFNFQEIPLSEALATYADFTKQNIVVDSGIDTLIDVRLTNLTANEILSVFIEMYDLHIIKKGNVLMVMRRVDYEKRHQSKKSVIVLIKYLDADLLKDSLASNSSKSSKDSANKSNTINFNQETNAIILQGTAAFIERNKNLISKLDIKPVQIKLTAKLVIASNSDIENLGLRLNASASVVTDNPISSLVDLGVASSSSFGFLISKAGKFLLELELKALKEEGIINLISSPSLFTSSNKSASIQQGTQIPYQVQGENGAFHTEFKDAVLKMEFLPRYSGDEIILDILLSKDSVGELTLSGIAIEKRQIKTSVTLKDGETVVLGGIDDSSQSQQLNSVPFLSDIPYIGQLFTSRSSRVSDKKLVIFITPEIIGL